MHVLTFLLVAGDWLKYQLIDRGTQEALTTAAIGGTVVHSLIGAYAAYWTFHSDLPEDAGAKPARAAIAALRGFLCGFIELIRLLSLQYARGSQETEDQL